MKIKVGVKDVDDVEHFSVAVCVWVSLSLIFEAELETIPAETKSTKSSSAQYSVLHKQTTQLNDTIIV